MKPFNIVKFRAIKNFFISIHRHMSIFLRLDLNCTIPMWYNKKAFLKPLRKAGILLKNKLAYRR